MWKAQEQVREFMRGVKGLDLSPTLRIPTREERNLCIELMAEELSETEDAMSLNPPVGELGAQLVDVADGLADLLYVVLYTCNVYGMDIEPIFDEVQRSNMTKKGGPKSSTGKQLKPTTYSPPDLTPILQQML